ncbi:MAG: amidase [Gammaproteobacteria bacterium]|nr:amidase [Gammaproteobacteria bacterium]
MNRSVSLPSIRDLATLRARGAGMDVIAALRARYERYADFLKPYITHSPEWTRDELLRPPGETGAGLFGVPVSVKDLFGVSGLPTYAGSPMRLPHEFEQSGPVVQTLQRLGAAITGKTHTVEFAFGGLGSNPHWPVPRNPWDDRAHRVPGGSSAGAGVSLYCDARLALGTDTAGSVRIPASMTGVVGLKTSYGRWPVSGIVPLCPSLDTVGLLGHTVADVRYAFGLIDRHLGNPGGEDSGAVPSVSTLRFGIADALFWNGCDAGIGDAVRGALNELASAGAHIESIELSEARPALDIFKLGHLAAPELFEFLTTALPSWLPSLDPNVAARIQAASSTTACEYLRRRRRLSELARSTDVRLAGLDALVAPTVAVTPPRLDAIAEPDAYRRTNMRALRNTAVANLLNLCALTLPVGLDSEGLPVGLQLMARHGDDERLLAVADSLERCLGAARDRLGEPSSVTLNPPPRG